MAEPDLKPTPPSANRRAHALTAGLLGVGLVALTVMAFLPDDPEPEPPGAPRTVCGLRRLTGVPCPGCGMTRGMVALVRGEGRRAVVFHPLSPILAAALLAFLGRSAYMAITGRSAWAWLPRAVPWLLGGSVAALVGLWVWRLWSMAADGSLGVLWRASPLGRLFGGGL